MSDRSFVDPTGRGVVKNPLLSTAVTGLSIEDLTHNAVLLPVVQSQELVTRQDQQIGSQSVTLAQPDPGSHGDGRPHPPSAFPPLDPPTALKEPLGDDDFDVNEYFARLQVTTYVSAPINTSLKDLKEENLEEINLNEPEKPEEVQQSITADIAQNFSQLPTVLPQVASAVFSSFSNMLNYKSREVTPDERHQEAQRPYQDVQRPHQEAQRPYQEVQRPYQGVQRVGEVGVPLMGVEEPAVPKEVAPPPKELPIGGTTSYRITTKKKAYAQIPGLSSQIPPQSISDQAQNLNRPPMAPPSYFTPDNTMNLPQIPVNVPPNSMNSAQNAMNEPQNSMNAPQNLMNVPQNPINVQQSNSNEAMLNIQPAQREYNIFNPMETQKDENTSIATIEPTLYAVTANDPVDKKQELIPTLPPDAVTNTNQAPIIPPPPMFSNIPRKDSLQSVGKSVLPPSVARRIGANHPIIQSIQAPSFSAENIFVPKPISDTPQDINTPITSTTESSKSESEPQDLPAQNLPSAFVQFKSSYSSISSMQNPYQEQEHVAEATERTHIQRPMIPQNDGRLKSPQSASIRLPSPNQMGTSPPSFFDPANHFNATRRISIESAVATNTANISQFSSPPPTFFNPANISLRSMNQAPQSVVPPVLTPGSFDTQTVAPTSNLNPIQPSPIAAPQHLDHHAQTHTTEPTRPIPEPPKLTGGLNYRMTKKRPQYYSGPIEGIGDISNNVKPVIPGSDVTAFQGALFTPDQQVNQVVDESVPFDISKPAEMTSSYTPFAINSQINSQAQSYVQPEYTPFDLSRPTTETYDPLNYEIPKQESKGFGIIGSLKSKLSSLDINKIQNSVTTFFDPAYRDMKKEDTNAQGSAPYDNQANIPFGYSNQDSNLEIFVPNVDNQPYNQSYSSGTQYHNIYSSPQILGHDKSTYEPNCPGNAHSNRHFANPPNELNTFPNVLPTCEQVVLNYPFPQDSANLNILQPEVPPYQTIYGAPQAYADNNAFHQNQCAGYENHGRHFPKPPIDTITAPGVLPPSTSSSLINPSTPYSYPETPKDTSAKQSYTNTESNIDDNGNQDGNLEELEKETANLTSASVVENTFNTYNLFSNPNKNTTPAVIDDLSLNKTDELANIIKLESSALSFFDKPLTDKGKFPISHIETDSLLNNIAFIPTQNIDVTPDFGVDIIRPKHCSSDFFGTTDKSTDFVQNQFGCAFTKKGNDDDVADIVENVIKAGFDESIDLTLNDVKDDIPTLDMSAVPLFGLSSILAEKTKEITQLEDSMKNVTTQEVQILKARLNSDTIAGIFETEPTTAHPLTDEENDGVSELNICETCREIDKPEDKDVDNFTIKLIENITSPIQLLNPVVASLTEAIKPGKDTTDFDSDQCAEISHITEETIETIQVQSATELLDEVDEISNTVNYGWVPENNPLANSVVVSGHSYTFQMDDSSIGFFGNNPMFFDNIPNNASDEIKAEYKNTQEDPSVVLPRQMSVPTAPPAEDDDSKSDGTGGLDVHSIEQDAKKDFPLYEEFVIEPSATDDGKIEYKEKEISSENPVQEVDSFTNRVERFKQMEETVDKLDDVGETNPVFDIASATSPAMTIASYFDTGNYAVEAHYKNSLSSPSSVSYPVSSPNVQMSIPPGFEDEYKRRLSGIVPQDVIDKVSDADVNLRSIPDASSQISPVETTANSSNVNYVNSLLTDSAIKEKHNEKQTDAKLPELSSIFDQSHALSSSIFEKVEDKKETTESSLISSAKTEKHYEKPAEVTLPDSIFGRQSEDVPSSSAYGKFEDKKETTELLLDSSVKTDKQVERTAAVKLPEITSMFDHQAPLSSSIFGKVEDKKEITEALTSSSAKEPQKPEKPQQQEFKKPLQDPISFFGQDTTETSDSGMNRLASYFQTPAKADHGKSFFELSQSQNHYRHASISDTEKIITKTAQSSKTVKDFFDSNANLDNTINIPSEIYAANLQLMQDLTSAQNIPFSVDQNINTVNYFTVEYDNKDLNLNTDLKNVVFKESNVKIDGKKDNSDDDAKLMADLSKCVYCTNYDCRNVFKILENSKLKFRKTTDSDSSDNNSNSGTNMEPASQDQRRDVAVTFGPLDQDNEGVSLTTENRTTAEYTPVKHHWFYRVDIEGKSIWRGFSDIDNRALEDAYHSPDLTEDTLVPTDGGRFDVNVMGRLRIAVYWNDKPSNVLRCSWFYKGATDARYVPYTELIAEKLEEEYRHGITTGEWHRRLVLPDNESVVMHGPGVMVHFPQSASDAFGSAPFFPFAKRVYRNPVKIKVCSDQPAVIDHLLLLVHGAGEYGKARERERQSTMRPRVVRRGCDETEIEDTEPSSIDHLLLLCHGVGSACDMRFRPVEEVVDDFRATSLQLLQSHYRNSYDKGVVNRVEVLPISWHATLHSGEAGVDKRLAAITLDSIPKLRNFTNDTVLDVLFYTSPVFCQTIIDTVCAELNRIYQLFMQRNPNFKGAVSLGGHSLGSVILYDLLCHQAAGAPGKEDWSSRKSFVTGPAGSGQGSVNYPSLDFQPASLYALGSPIAMFECIRGVKSLGADFCLPTCKNFFNIFHPYDPIAYRIEPLINAQLGSVKPFLIPHHKGRKRMHLELRDTMARVGADLKAKLLESLKATWSSMWKQQPPPNDEQLEKVVEEEMEKEQLCEENKEEIVQNEMVVSEALGRLNDGRRVDYVLQEAPFEMINEYLFAMRSHVGYWESEDTMLLILREIYDALGAQPDGSVPMQSMTVQRTRAVQPEDSDTVITCGSEHPSTSREGT